MEGGIEISLDAPASSVKIGNMKEDGNQVSNTETSKETPNETSNEFSVCQFFQDDTYEYVRRFVSAEEAMKAFQSYTTSVGARLGTTKKVIITDGGDCINAEWQYGKGLTYPKLTQEAPQEE